MKNIFIDQLSIATRRNKNICLIVNDLGFGMVENYSKEFPRNIFNAGISEQSMIGYAAGLAAKGKHVFVYSIANFNTFRCAEQIRNDVDYHNLPVTIVSAGAGVSYGNLGYSHHAIQDYSLIRSFPNMLIASPGDIMELKSCIEYLIKNPQPSYLRLDKSSNYQIHKKKPKISPGKWVKVFDHKKNFNNREIYLTTGAVIKFVKDKIANKKYLSRSLFSMPLWGMKFKKNQNNNLKKFTKIIVVEDHFQDGGFQSWLNESTNNQNSKTKIISKSISSSVVNKVGSQEHLMKFLI
jgi:transketolase